MSRSSQIVTFRTNPIAQLGVRHTMTQTKYVCPTCKQKITLHVTPLEAPWCHHGPTATVRKPTQMEEQ